MHRHLLLFAVDESKPFIGKAWQIASRFTWELPQTVSGILLYGFYTAVGEQVRYHKGITEIESKRFTITAFTMGHVIIYNPLYAESLSHEFGHTVQSRILGPLYYPFIVVPSLITAITDVFFHTGIHSHMPWETWAQFYKSKY